ncbi:FecCD family ABC transporter permease [Celerinatantimonas diazotrophica]|uniref:Iron complex transport system permease protein n=1 Tax=Celerinatantimonas diazotrophica TaxID=412034 RepID=A0A4R1JAF5_9GAMM|nr:iron ABC transporter permease [Celerinatantimonas diazotrophica]TCK47079.1 iron complex transport system permease protein [Celerinatantimonas diazotrophica]CAG9295848.1 Hemin transport system permease protein HmuU [Celerinatantimonas diazotrophica]
MTESVISPQPKCCGAVVYKNDIRRKLLWVISFTLLAVIAAITDVLCGSGTLPWKVALNGIFHPEQVSTMVRVVIWDLRMPVTLTAVLAGIGLSLAGSLMQTVLDNPLAEPFTLGISAAAGFGAALVIVFQTALVSWLPVDYLLTANAFIFSLVTVLFIGIFAARCGLSVEIIVMLGIAVHFIFSALLGLAQYLADVNQLQSLVFWMMGSLQKSNWTQVGINAAIIAVILPILLLLSWQISALRGFGEQAQVLGIPVAKLRMLLLVFSALMASAITATIGVVGFIGLVAPHVARMLVGEDQRFTQIMTMVVGALLMTVASIVSKMLIPGVILPIGMVTSLLGVPFFLWLILGRRVRRN